MQSASTCLDRGSTNTRQLLDSYSTATRQLLDSYSTGSTGKALTAPRQWPRQRLDGASTAVDPARQPRGSIHNRHHTVKAKFLRRGSGAVRRVSVRLKSLESGVPNVTAVGRLLRSRADFGRLPPPRGHSVTKHFAHAQRGPRSRPARWTNTHWRGVTQGSGPDRGPSNGPSGCAR